jgi:hypothetical protein
LVDIDTNYKILGKITYENSRPKGDDIVFQNGTDSIIAVGHNSVYGYCGRTVTMYTSYPENCCNIIGLGASKKPTNGSWIVRPYDVKLLVTKDCDFVEIRSSDIGNNHKVLGKITNKNSHLEGNDITLPDDTISITAVGHHSVNGYCGRTKTLTFLMLFIIALEHWRL